MNVLQIRLKNCLQTILELQPAMRKRYKSCFAEDFPRLREYIEKIQNMALNEEEVARLEKMTAAFLREVEYSGALIPAGRLH